MESSADAVSRFFKQKAELDSAVVAEVSSPLEAFLYSVDLCQKKDDCQLLVSGCQELLSKTAEDLCNLKQEKKLPPPACCLKIEPNSNPSAKSGVSGW